MLNERLVRAYGKDINHSSKEVHKTGERAGVADIHTTMIISFKFSVYHGPDGCLQDNQLHGITKRHIQQSTERVTEAMGHRLSGITQ